MSQLKFYQLSTWGLLLLNLTLVALFLVTKPAAPGQRMGKNFSRESVRLLALDASQEEDFQELAHAHNRQMTAINAQQQELLTPYFSSLTHSAMAVDTAMLMQQVMQLEQQKITATYQHFEAVKGLLRADQQGGFEAFVNQALRRILHKSLPQNPRPPRGL